MDRRRAMATNKNVARWAARSAMEFYAVLKGRTIEEESLVELLDTFLDEVGFYFQSEGMSREEWIACLKREIRRIAIER